MDGQQYLHPQILANIEQSKEDGGVFYDKVGVGRTIKFQTRNTLYTLEKRGEDEYWIKGHALYCPEFTKCFPHGSTWGSSMLKINFVGVGMHFEFSTDKYNCITTSSISAVEVL